MSAHPLVGGATLELVVLGGAIRKQAKQASKCHPSMASASAPASRFLPSLPFSDDWYLEVYVKINPFLPKLLLAMVFYHSNRSPKTAGNQNLLQYK